MSNLGEADEKKYITGNFCGGLGNQLFIAACVEVLAREYNLIPIYKKLDSSPSIFKNRPVYFNNIMKKLNVVNEDVYNKINFIKVKEISSAYNPIILKSNKSYMLEGYFQSPKYFKKYINEIRELFSFDGLSEIESHYRKLSDKYLNTVSIHVRRGDYLMLSHFHNVLPLSYYEQAVKHFGENSLFLVFSDDIEWCKENLANLNLKNIMYIENLPKSNIPGDLFELQLMSLCNGNIIANSSFSAWAAYLNKNVNKKVIAPRQWFVPEDANSAISDIRDNDWITI
jgi:hypothetical protein